MPQSQPPAGVRVVQGSTSGYRAEQGSDYLPGVSAETVGSETLWLGIVTIPPGGRTKAHVHARHESAFYMMSGEVVEMWSGEGLTDLRMWSKEAFAIKRLIDNNPRPLSDEAILNLYRATMN
jgi:uncharacterized RmlC-like cupin family protein